MYLDVTSDLQLSTHQLCSALLSTCTLSLSLATTVRTGNARMWVPYAYLRTEDGASRTTFRLLLFQNPPLLYTVPQYSRSGQNERVDSPAGRHNKQRSKFNLNFRSTRLHSEQTGPVQANATTGKAPSHPTRTPHRSKKRGNKWTDPGQTLALSAHQPP